MAGIGQQIIDEFRHAFSRPAHDFGCVFVVLEIGVGVAQRYIEVRSHDGQWIPQLV